MYDFIPFYRIWLTLSLEQLTKQIILWMTGGLILQRVINFSVIVRRFATMRVMPLRDAEQDVTSTSVTLVNGQIEVNFTRPLETGNDNDFNLTDNQNCFYLLVASGEVADFDTYMIMQHDYRAASMDRYCFSSAPPSPPSGAGMITGNWNISCRILSYQLVFSRSVSMATPDDCSCSISALIVMYMSRLLQQSMF